MTFSPYIADDPVSSLRSCSELRPSVYVKAQGPFFNATYIYIYHIYLIFGLKRNWFVTLNNAITFDFCHVMMIKHFYIIKCSGA